MVKLFWWDFCEEQYTDGEKFFSMEQLQTMGAEVFGTWARLVQEGV